MAEANRSETTLFVWRDATDRDWFAFGVKDETGNVSKLFDIQIGRLREMVGTSMWHQLCIGTGVDADIGPRPVRVLLTLT